ncbi:MAG: sel1 repeat family protein [Rhodospirillales bacterium]|nr:sel1 repeat family protein [Rhodospirillales bacterium]
MTRKRLWVGLGLLAAVLIVAYFALRDTEAEIEQARVQAEKVAQFQAVKVKAVAGEHTAQFALARFFHQGVGVKKDISQAVRWYEKAAEKSHVGAQFALGNLFESGEGLRQDFRKAAEWYDLAANIGKHAGAQFALAQLYYEGRGVPNDPSQALKWYRNSAARGHAGAQYRLGAIHEAGWGVKADPAEAYKWYTLAAQKQEEALAADKDFDAIEARDKLAARMTRFDISRGEKMAAKFSPAHASRSYLREGTALLGKLPPDQKTDDPKPTRTGLRVLAMDVPLTNKEAKDYSVNLIVELIDPAASAAVCGLAPRVNEAVFQALWSNPVPIFRGRPDLRNLPDRLLDPVNKGLGSVAVKSVFFFPGDGPLNRNQVMQTPFDKIVECGNGS